LTKDDSGLIGFPYALRWNAREGTGLLFIFAAILVPDSSNPEGYRGKGGLFMAQARLRLRPAMLMRGFGYQKVVWTSGVDDGMF
jgi:hypothetical protein